MVFRAGTMLAVFGFFAEQNQLRCLARCARTATEVGVVRVSIVLRISRYPLNLAYESPDLIVT